MTDQPLPPDGEDPPRRSGLDVARQALAAAKAEASRRGLSAQRGGRAQQESPTRAEGPARRYRRGSAEQRSGAHPDERDPQALGSALDRLLADRGWQTGAAVGGVMGRWAAIVGPDLAAHCAPVSYHDGELVVQAESTAWATQLRLLAPSLVRRLNEELGDGTVGYVKVLGPATPTWVRGRFSVKGRGPRDTYG